MKDSISGLASTVGKSCGEWDEWTMQLRLIPVYELSSSLIPLAPINTEILRPRYRWPVISDGRASLNGRGCEIRRCLKSWLSKTVAQYRLRSSHTNWASIGKKQLPKNPEMITFPPQWYLYNSNSSIRKVVGKLHQPIKQVVSLSISRGIRSEA